MTQPVSFNLTRAVSEKRIVAAPKQAAAPARPAIQQVTPNVPLPKLTSLARELVAEGPPYDLARIAQISQAIATGDYKIDIAAITDAILRRMPSAER